VNRVVDVVTDVVVDDDDKTFTKKLGKIFLENG
jgi:carbamate kinase